MTKRETQEVLNRVFRLYMTQARKLPPSDRDAMAQTWFEEFHDTDYPTVLKAVNMYANQGKPFMPNVPDIISEIIRMGEVADNDLFAQLVKAVQLVHEPEKRVVIDDLGGIRYSEEHQRMVYFPPECHWATNYTQADFAALPYEIQMYAEDIEGLRALKREIDSDYNRARRRFTDALPYIRAGRQ